MKTIYTYGPANRDVENIYFELVNPEVISTVKVNQGGVSFEIEVGVNGGYVSLINHLTTTMEVDTDKVYPITLGNRLVSIDGPIEKSISLDDKFKGCYSLIRISDDIFEKNTHIETLTGTFEDCLDLCIVNTNFLKPMNNLKSLVRTFKNTDTSFVTKSTFSGLWNREIPIELIETFCMSVELKSISLNAFEDLNINSMKGTFSDCIRLTSIHPETIKSISSGTRLIETFARSGIVKVDPNLEAYFNEYVTLVDIFKDCELQTTLNKFK